MKKSVLILLGILLMIALLTGCRKGDNHSDDAVSFRLENESGQKLYGAALSFGTENTVFGSVGGENASGITLSDKGKDCLVFHVETGDLKDAQLQDMIFDFYVCTKKDSDYVYVGRVLVTTGELHQKYTITITEMDGMLILDSNDPDLYFGKKQ